MLKELIISMRPKQWYKNLVIFVGIVFSLNLMDLEIWLNIVPAFIIFCMLSGSEYLINDVLDIEKDKRHPKKCKRPIASGNLKASYALLFAILLVIIAGWSAYLINIPFLFISLAYYLLILSYSIFLKHLIIVDILGICIGFVIRAVAGCIAINVIITPWLIICAFLLALFLALGKRKHELILLGDDAKAHRKNLAHYSTDLLGQMINITSGALIISYSLYTFLTDNIYMMLTIPFVIYGLFRYLFMAHTTDIGGAPEDMFKDRGIIICMMLWSVLIFLILYRVPESAVELVGGV